MKGVMQTNRKWKGGSTCAWATAHQRPQPETLRRNNLRNNSDLTSDSPANQRQQCLFSPQGARWGIDPQIRESKYSLCFH
jgi:hypothetical protein